MIAIVALLWMRLSVPPLPELPAHLALPGGVRPQALTFAPDWIVVVDQTGAVWLFDRQSGDLVSQTPRP